MYGAGNGGGVESPLAHARTSVGLGHRARHHATGIVRGHVAPLADLNGRIAGDGDAEDESSG